MEILHNFRSVKLIVGIIVADEIIISEESTGIIFDKEDRKINYEVPKDEAQRVKEGDKLLCIYQYNTRKDKIFLPLLLLKIKTEDFLFVAGEAWRRWYRIYIRDKRGVKEKSQIKK